MPVRIDGALQLAAEDEWLLTGPPTVIERVVGALPVHSERLEEGLAVISFGNAVGRIELPDLGAVAISSRKWGEGTFDAMLGDLLAAIAALPFSAGSTPGTPFELRRVEMAPVAYHKFVYLRYVLSDSAPRGQRLIVPLQLVTRDPNRRWEAERVAIPLEELAAADQSSVLSVVTSPMQRVQEERLRSRPALSRLAGQLGGHLPAMVSQSRVRADIDTPENRFVKRFLDEALRVAAIAERLGRSTGGAFGRRLADDAARCGVTLRRVRQNPLWDLVADSGRLPLTSTVLQSRRGYREVFDHWISMRRTAGLPLDPEAVAALLETKDIATLYELWCYFKVVEAVSRLLGPPKKISRPAVSPTEVSIQHEYAADWDGVRVSYNGRFRRSATAIRRAYSTPLRPDIVIEDRLRRRLHLLDAKFRVEAKGGALSFKRADPHKMHAYRDAVTQARSAWVLYPGEVFRWYPLPGAIGEGVGCIPLDPLGQTSRLDEVVTNLLRNAE